jgi:hypothetical protein
MDHTSESQPVEKVSRQSCVNLLNDPSPFRVLQTMLEICNTEVEDKLEHKIVNNLYNKEDKKGIQTQ